MHREGRAKPGEKAPNGASSLVLINQLKMRQLDDAEVKEYESRKADGEDVKDKKRVKQKRGKSFRR